MNGGWGFIFILGWFILLITIGAYHSQQKDQATTQLVKIIKQAGGERIKVECVQKWGTKGVVTFTAVYHLHDVYQYRKVQAELDDWGRFTGTYYWDKPLQPDHLSATSVISSKEQIISDMDAEIQRLRQELAQATGYE